MTEGRRLAAIMFVDMVGYTAASQSDESGAIRRVQELDSLVRPIISRSSGRKVKSTGDGMMVEFDSALKACRCALEVQQRLHERNAQSPGPSIEVRVGIHLGDVEESQGDILGDAVNIAARIEPLAESGGICISGEVYAQVRNKDSTVWELVPSKALKGIQQPVTVYRAALPWKGREAVPRDNDHRRIAVLPFANFSPDPKDEYFADGLTEELITVLAKVEGLRVIARTSVFPYKSTTKPLPQVGAELGVASVLEGSVRKAGDRIRITAQLIDVASQVHRWAEAYDRRLEDVFAVQTEVAREVAKALQLRLGRQEDRRLEGHPVATESYLAYLQGRTAMAHSYSEQKLREAQWQFERAIGLDPTNARACAALAECTHLIGLFHRHTSRTESDSAARELALKALRLDPNLADGHSALGLLSYSNMEWEAAEKEAQLALTLNPSYSNVRSWYSLLLQEQGRGEEALREMSLAFESDPQSRMLALLLTGLCLTLRKVDQGQRALERLRDLDSSGRAYQAMSALYHFLQGDPEGALRESEASDKVPADNGYVGPSANTAYILAASGQVDRAREVLQKIESRGDDVGPPELLAIVYAMIGSVDDSFRLLHDKLAKEGNLGLQMIRLSDLAEPIRQDPRFAEILKRLRLAP